MIEHAITVALALASAGAAVCLACMLRLAHRLERQPQRVHRPR